MSICMLSIYQERVNKMNNNKKNDNHISQKERLDRMIDALDSTNKEANKKFIQKVNEKFQQVTQKA